MNTETTGRHPVNTGHLVMGLAFAGLVGIWALVTSDLVTERDIRWLMPLPWVIAGAVGLAVAAWGSIRGKRQTYDAQPGFEPTAEPTVTFDTEPTRPLDVDDHEETTELTHEISTGDDLPGEENR